VQSWEDARGEYRRHPVSERGRIVPLERTRLSAEHPRDSRSAAHSPAAPAGSLAGLLPHHAATPPDLTWLSVRPVMVPADLRITEDDVHQPTSDGLRCEGREDHRSRPQFGAPHPPPPVPGRRSLQIPDGSWIDGLEPGFVTRRTQARRIAVAQARSYSPAFDALCRQPLRRSDGTGPTSRRRNGR
jgi:hypothetical protein